MKTSKNQPTKTERSDIVDELYNSFFQIVRYSIQIVQHRSNYENRHKRKEKNFINTQKHSMLFIYIFLKLSAWYIVPLSVR